MKRSLLSLMAVVPFWYFTVFIPNQTPAGLPGFQFDFATQDTCQDVAAVIASNNPTYAVSMCVQPKPMPTPNCPAGFAGCP